MAETFRGLRSSGFISLLFGSLIATDVVRAGTTDEVVSKAAPYLNQGTVKGSVRVMSGGDLNLNSGLSIDGALILPGTPGIRLNGGAVSPQVSSGSGSAQPDGYWVTLNSGVSLGGITKRVDPQALPLAEAPLAGAGTRQVHINQPGDDPGEFSTIQTLTINAQGASLVLPPGRYERISINGASTVTLSGGTAESPALYEIQQIDLNAGSHLDVAGPVVLRLRNSINANGDIGNAAHPEWLVMSLSAGSLTLNSPSAFHGKAIVPAGTLTVNGGTLLRGSAFTDRLILNGGGVIECETGGGTPNQAPVASPSVASTPLGTPVQITLQASDPEGQALSYTLVSPPSHGTINTTTGNALPGATVVYTPGSGFVGTDVFHFKASDGVADSETVAVTVDVFQPNRAPTAESRVFVLNQGESDVSLELQASDPDGDPLSWQILDQPSQGVLAGSPPALTYTHTGTRSRTVIEDSFTYQVTDSSGASSEIAAATLQLQPVNETPEASALAVKTLENLPASFLLTATDADGDPLTFTISSPASHGSVTLDGAQATYAPDPGFSGVDRFRFTASDGSLSSQPVEVTIVVDGAPSVTVLSPLSGAKFGSEDPVRVQVDARDPEGELTSEELYLNGIRVGSAGFEMVLERLQVGDHTLVAAVTDAAGQRVESAPVTFTVSAANRAPLVSAGSDYSIALGALGPNLLVNGGNEEALEEDAIPGWTAVGSTAWGKGDAASRQWSGTPRNLYPAPPEGVSFFHVPGNESGELVQDLVLSANQRAEVAGGAARFAFSAKSHTLQHKQRLIQDYTGRPSAYVPTGELDRPDAMVEFYDGDDHLLASHSAVSALVGDRWLTMGTGGLVPAGTARIRVRLIATKADSADTPLTVFTSISPQEKNDALFDEVSLRLGTTSASLLAGSVTDDGLPSDSLSSLWSQESGPAAEIAEPTRASTTVSLPSPGDYEFRLEATDGELSSADSVKIHVTSESENLPPVVSAGPDVTADFLTQSIPLEGQVTDDGITQVIAWSQVSGPGNAAFSDPLSASTTVSVPYPGLYCFKLSAFDGEWSGEDLVLLEATASLERQPLDLVIVTDHSGSMWALKSDTDPETPIYKARLASRRLIESLDPAYDRVALRRNHREFQPLTSDMALAISKITQYQGEGGTYGSFQPSNIDRGIQGALDHFNANPRPAPLDRVIVVFNDGAGPYSDVAARAAREAGIRVIVVSFSNHIDPIDSINMRLQATTPADFVSAKTPEEALVLLNGLLQKMRFPLNTAPQVSAGAMIQLARVSDTTFLRGSFSDDGLPANSVPSIAWEQVSGPVSAILSDPHSLTPQVSFTEAGEYRFKLTVDDGELSTSDIVRVRVSHPGGLPAPAGMTAWWPFDGNLRDAVGSRHLTRYGWWGTPRFTTGVANDAVRLVDSSDVMIAGPVGEIGLNSPEGFSIEFRMRANSTAPGFIFALTDPVTGYPNKGLTWGSTNFNYPGKLQLVSPPAGPSSGYGDFQINSTPLSVNSWHHVVITHNRASKETWSYVNGVGTRISTAPIGPYYPSGSTLTVGGLIPSYNALNTYVTTDPSRRFDGDLDDLAFYSRPLTASEVQQLNQAVPDGKTPPTLKQAPVVDAGEAIFEPDPLASVALKGFVSDDAGTPNIEWRKLSGPGNAMFADVSSAVTNVTFDEPGVYTLQLHASNGVFEATDTVQVQIGMSESLAAPSGLVAWMPGNRHAVDLINDRTGIWSGPEAYGEMKVGDGFQFGNTVSRVRYLPPLTPPPLADGFTVEGWLYVPASPTNTYSSGVLTFQNNAGVKVHQLSLSAASNSSGITPRLTWQISRSDGSGQIGDAFIACPTDRPFHFALVHGSSGARAYIDGVLSRSFSTNGIYAHHFDKELYLGTPPGDSRIFPGKIDELSLYNRALTPTEISAVIQAGANGKSLSPVPADPRVDAGVDSILAPGESRTFAPVIDPAAFGESFASAWSTVSGPAAVVFDDPALPDTTATFPKAGRYVLRLTVSGGATVASDTVTVEVVAPANGNPVIHFPATLSLQLPQGTIDLEPQVTDDGLPDGTLTSRWVQLSGPGTVVFTDLGDFKTQAVFPAAGEYELVFEVSDGLATTYHNVRASVAAPLPPNQAPVVDAGPDFVSDSATFVLNGSATDDGLPGNQPLVYTWSVVSAPGPVSFTNEAVTVFSAGTYRLKLVVSDGELSGEDEVTVVVPESASGLPNRAPVISLPASVTADLPGAEVSFDPVVTDDGRTPGPLAYTWSQLDGPAAVSVAQPTSASTTVSFTVAGDYLFQLSVSDGALTSIARVRVRVNAPDNRAPVITMAPAVSAKPYETKILSAVVTDDGQPTGTLTHAWRQLSGPEVAFLETPAAAQTQVTFGRGGSYVFELLVSDGALSTRATVAWNVIGTPDARIVSPATGTQVTDRTLLTLQGRAWIDGGSITSLHFEKNGQSIGTGIRQRGTDDWLLQLPPLGLGSHTITAVATSADGQTKTSEPVSFEIVDFEEQALTLDITAPFEGDAITAPTEVIGTAYSTRLASWTLSLTPVVSGAQVQPAPTVIASSTRPVVDDVLGTIDPTLLQNGAYQLILSGTTTAGVAATYSVPFTIEGNMKIGHFSLAFEDLTVPLAGLPLTVTRVYDSRDTKTGDFGPAWNVGLNSVRLRKIGRMGEGWEQEQVISGFFPLHSVNSVTRKRVVLTFPDGRTETFEPELRAEAPLSADQPNVQKVLAIQSGYLQFKALDGSKGTLAIEGSSNVLWNGEIPGRGQLVDFNLQSINPTRFRYTEPEGTSYVIDESTGLMSVSEPNGNTLTINRDGMFHSTGENVLFTRDSQGRIIEVTDPAGAKVLYGYDASGRLQTVTDRTDAVTTFHYENPNFPHYLTRIVDPRGIDAIRTEYGEDGRLARQIDAAGQAIEFEHDLADNREIIRDRLGNVTVHEYDDRGNVTRTTDALGGVTSYTYDANDNETSVTSPLGFTTTRAYDGNNNLLAESDPLGHVTRYSYDASRRPLTIADALGQTTALTYSFHGNLLSMQDPAGTSTAFGYDGNGNLATITDAFGTTTRSTHDSKGNELGTTVTDASGNVLRAESHTYDTNGNRLTTTLITDDAALVTSFQYDAANRLTLTTYPDGSTSETIYNEIGKPWKSIDAAGRETVMTYDARGNLTRTDYPDGTFTTAAYDAEGRQTASTDAAGVTTYTLYDALGRTTTTIAPDETMPATVLTEVAAIAAAPELADNPRTTTIYDADGRVTATTDPLGNTTSYEYDAAGRRTATIDALGNRFITAYDAAGRQTSTTDAKGNTTTYSYDAAGRLTRTDFPDGTFTATGYDALGRRTSSTDQEGNTTQYGYDPQGRLITVTDALGGVTRYGYDSRGLQTTQTDALGRTTSYEYDAMGRRTARILPEGQREEMTYDILGRLTELKDFNGSVITRTYDPANDRLLAVVAPADHHSLALSHAPARYEFSYDVLGRRTAAVVKNASGTAISSESYFYDVRARLTGYAGPTGGIGYGYDANGNLAGAKSSTPGGYDVSYDYDALSRISRVYRGQEGNDPNASGLAAYSYDANGNLHGVSHVNGVQHAYTYNALNRLTALAVTSSNPQSPISNPQSLQGYSYTLNANGHRTHITEHSGRSIAHTYDALHRLTRETISSSLITDHRSLGTLSYTYDAVSNRSTRTSSGSVAQLLPSQTQTFTANDRLTSDTYDANGNTTGSVDVSPASSLTDTYSFDNRLIRRTRADGLTIDLTYNPDGHRLTKFVSSGGLTQRLHHYLTDANNPTGYAQVIEETDPLAPEGQQLKKVHLYGHDLIATRSADLQSASSDSVSYYLYDGLGSVRGITNETGDLQETYDYDAYGTLIGLTKRNAEGVLESFPITNNQSLITKSEFLFAGEQFDSDLGMYFLRARYLNTQTGRFHTQDTYEGRNGDPLTLHKYLYGHGNPVMFTDPSGNMTLVMDVGLAINLSITLNQAAGIGVAAIWIGSKIIRSSWIIGLHFEGIHASVTAENYRSNIAFTYDWTLAREGLGKAKGGVNKASGLPLRGLHLSTPILLGETGKALWEKSIGVSSDLSYERVDRDAFNCWTWSYGAIQKAFFISLLPI